MNWDDLICLLKLVGSRIVNRSEGREDIKLVDAIAKSTVTAEARACGPAASLRPVQDCRQA